MDQAQSSDGNLLDLALRANQRHHLDKQVPGIEFCPGAKPTAPNTDRERDRSWAGQRGSCDLPHLPSGSTEVCCRRVEGGAVPETNRR